MVVRAAEDYYDTLGVSKTADKKEIKSAYRQKVRRLHDRSLACTKQDSHSRNMRNHSFCVPLT